MIGIYACMSVLISNHGRGSHGVLMRAARAALAAAEPSQHPDGHAWQVVVVFLSWLSLALQPVPLAGVLAIFLAVGIAMFLIPIIPGVPVYVCAGVLRRPRGPNSPVDPPPFHRPPPRLTPRGPAHLNSRLRSAHRDAQ